jgi:hypothetical protein
MRKKTICIEMVSLMSLFHHMICSSRKLHIILLQSADRFNRKVRNHNIINAQKNGGFDFLKAK